MIGNLMNTDDFKDIIKSLTKKDEKSTYRIGTIADATGKPKIRFAGETNASQKRYTFLDSYTPVVGDRVLLARVQGTYVVLGKISQG